MTLRNLESSNSRTVFGCIRPFKLADFDELEELPKKHSLPPNRILNADDKK